MSLLPGSVGGFRIWRENTDAGFGAESVVVGGGSVPPPAVDEGGNCRDYGGECNGNGNGNGERFVRRGFGFGGLREDKGGNVGREVSIGGEGRRRRGRRRRERGRRVEWEKW